MPTKNKISTAFDIVSEQKEAMLLIRQQIGVPQTIQVQMGLNLYLQQHKSLLENAGYIFNDEGVLERKQS